MARSFVQISLQFFKLLSLVSLIIQFNTFVKGSRVEFVENSQNITKNKYIGWDVLSYGATGDGINDDSEAFQKAWSAACGIHRGVLEVPIGKSFLINPIIFEGPCNGETNFVLEGTIVAPKSISSWKDLDDPKWIKFEELSNLVVKGRGTFDGQGEDWWACKKSKDCERSPSAVTFQKCDNCAIIGVRFVNSQQKHFVFSESNHGLVDSITIEAPDDSPNTDGIHLDQCSDIIVRNSNVKTGDDCVSVGEGNSNIKITNMYCGIGCHGISIGSLGKNGEKAEVSNVQVSNCFLEDNTNGLRIKTWPGGEGYARDISYTNVLMRNVKHPIIIDQDYCPKVQGECEESLTGVQISNVSYNNIFGTSITDEAITFDCSENIPCLGITMNDVQLIHVDYGEFVTMNCTSAQGSPPQLGHGSYAIAIRSAARQRSSPFKFAPPVLSHFCAVVSTSRSARAWDLQRKLDCILFVPASCTDTEDNGILIDNAAFARATIQLDWSRLITWKSIFPGKQKSLVKRDC